MKWISSSSRLWFVVGVLSAMSSTEALTAGEAHSTIFFIYFTDGQLDFRATCEFGLHVA